MKKKEFLKAPFNYIGNKYRIISKIQPLFPKKIDIMVDLFCGGGDVIINTDAKIKYANDINFYVVDIMKEFQKRSDEILVDIDKTISTWNLSKTNEESYKIFRNYYNKTKKPLDLYVLMCYSFNYQFRFNNDHEYNNPFGKNRSSFNANMRKNLVEFIKNIKDIRFTSKNFMDFNLDFLTCDDFVYADPPYTLTCGSYNDGKRGFKGWKISDDCQLFKLLIELNNRGVKFALSNVLEHKGNKNELLIDWVNENGYKVYDVDFNYDNCNYQTRNKNNITREVLITNY
ncbi:MAG: Dam family site-specific DNA-(adenine-N6)-methyltransferase [Selenomonadales bacterium]|nr:Dam family site-specific DNA-(adenine-N6)-methyltransferase [Selenomonadales bacterium]